MRRFLTSRWLIAVGLLTLWLGGIRAAGRSPAAMAEAAAAFLESLTPELRQQASFPFQGDERLHWGFVPTEAFPRNGLTIKAMSEPQRALARKLLQAGLSQRGYQNATSIMDLENILGALEGAGRSAEPRRGDSMLRDPERYYVSVFGTPSAKGTWGWRVEGHHISLNFTVVKGTFVASSPSFFGTNPAEVRDGPKKGLRILAAEEDSARALLMALSPEQQKQALINTAAPNDIATGNRQTADPLTPSGVAAAALDAKQRELLMRLLGTYTSQMASDIAEDRMAKVRKAGIEKIAFAWAGEAERGKRHYYRVQGPTFLIEYDNTQNNANHIHSVWRDFDGDFGRDLLREHLTAVAH